ncbi:phosphatase PAP2 family protein [Paenibacillus sp. ClWae2A]|uniref:phosphatase PAP2 family protein n=1 Tax=Paenibacillus sp. ClWae2A TaxID=3057177 RepID=UPI0028F6143D|nr:phosphatase PAP2 family protein [Paenibacillus sp. ClWae2A]MDT9723151.1 phosphatase PAP2 family protein [Paenibacillus sp. ClWae2A]
MLLLAVLTGVSRVYEGVHYPGDILGGFLLGMLNSRSLLSLVLPKMGDFFCVMFEVT